MLEKTFLQPDSMWKRVVGGHHLYSAIAVARGSDHAHIYLAGQVARDPATGEVVGKGDMTAQVRQVCENIKTGLEYVGATFSDVVKSVTYTMDIEEYYRCSGVRYDYFTTAPPTSTLIQISRLGHPDCLVEIEVEAIIEPERLTV
jgi:2-iminobutanoate/2-iminopropanoate deaminase